jgi:hypothetical protein
MELKKVALIVRGGVSTVDSKWTYEQTNNDRINYEGTYNSIVKNIINANPDFIFDVFIHSWDVELAQSLIRLYRPISHSFESNEIYSSEIKERVNNCGVILNDITRDTFYRVTSQALAIKKSIQLVEGHVGKTQTTYEKCIICRPDVLYMKKLDLSSYTESDSIYVNGPNTKGDLHFIMSYDNLIRFKNVYESISPTNLPAPQKCVANFVKNFLQKPYIADNLNMPTDLEVLRKISRKSLIHKLDIQEILDMGITVEQLKSYVS